MNPYHIFKVVPLSVLQMLARFVAWVIIKIPSLSIMRTIQINLALITHTLSEQQKRALTKDIIYHQCLTSIESIKSWAMPPEWSIAQICDVHNKDIFLEGLDNPNGMLAIVPHLGTWEMMNAWLNQFGAPTIMYKPVDGKFANEFILQGRARLNATLVPTDGSGVKAVFKTLKQGGFSIVLPDHVPEPSGGVVVPFFGIKTLTSTLASKLASKTKCALVGLSCIRRTDGRGFDIYCYKLNDPALYDRNAEVATHALNQAMERMITDNYSHYMWGYRRFKRIPDLGNPYRKDKETLAAFIQSHHSNVSSRSDSNINDSVKNDNVESDNVENDSTVKNDNTKLDNH
ncbi:MULTISPECIES: lysophospholipid acyltransferase family protein [unclassified Psychrobacter]|uniref:lysophospholipid acyltransferase family protein n=1 Tax=unclassified Psychrobacter TaxID=196806 RepID=UPI000C7F217D|nr:MULTISPECIES: lysophospholipid acyltransferase family protein [unclassified Psychrobacter]MCG3859558.1 lysophospholipid acyltransferase family protein [Psychrobacter sp. Ps2]MDN3447046.1 lysophospholipid acyltransferase family protein [Psychrobacter sp. APC 3281]PLT22868.1 lipid A biosynthesis acyltransferase [Psychrobacter sp. MES7-P7E]